MKWFSKMRYPCLALAGLCLTASLCLAQEGQGPEGRQRPGRGGRGGFGGGFGGPGGGGFMGMGQDGVGGTLRLLNNAAVQKDLELTQDQIDKIKKIDESYQEDLEEGRGNFDFQGLQDLSEEERGKKMAEFGVKMAAQTKKLNEKYQPKLEKALDKAHLDRIKQIQRQQAGTTALSRKDVVEALALSDDQQEQVKSVFAASQEEMQKLFPRGGFGGGPGGRGGAGGAGGAGGEGNEADATARQERFQKMQEQMQKLNEDRDTKLMAVLTDEQKAKFDELKGKPFDLSQLRGRGPGGPGGPGGRGGAGGRPGGPRERPPM